MDHASVFARHQAAAEGADSEYLVVPEWDEAGWRKLFALTTPRVFKPSEVVIQRGVVDRALYFVTDGLLEVGITYVDGISISPLASIGAGSVIGEQSFFDGRPRSANVWGLGAGELLCLTLEKFRQFADSEPPMATEFLFALGRLLSMRLRNTTGRIRR
jgi:CRP/FNR family cyclic AMP-dependent transcriptional regulator